MVIPVNARDVALQGSSSRVAASIKNAVLNASPQVFTYNAAGSLSPSTQAIAVTATRINTTQPIWWSTSPTVPLYTATSGGTTISQNQTDTTQTTTAYLRSADFGSNLSVQVQAVIQDISAITSAIVVLKQQLGATTVTLQLYQAVSGTAPAAPIGIGYTASTSVYTGLGSWSASQPATSTAGLPTYLTTTTITTNTPTIAVSGMTWSNPVVIAQNSPTTYLLELFQQANSIPLAPASNVANYTISGGILGGSPGSWTLSQPASSTTPTYMITAIISTNTPATAYSISNWSAPVIIAQQGVNGTTSYLVQLYNNTGATVPGSLVTYTISSGTLGGSGYAGWTLLQPTLTTAATQMTSALIVTTTPNIPASIASWSAGITVAQAGLTGLTGNSNYRVYIAATISSPPSTPGTTTSGATPAGWNSVPVTLSTGQAMYQSDGVMPSGTTTTTWNTPYQSYLKIANLEALGVSTGALTVDGILTLGTNGNIVTSGGGYGSTGVFLGYSGTTYKFSVGSGLTYDGATLSVSWGVLNSKPANIAALSGAENLGANLLNASNWVIGAAGDQTAGGGTQWTALTNTDGCTNQINLAAGPDGSMRPVWYAISGTATSLNPEGGIGGTSAIAIDNTKPYRFVCWIYLTGPTDGNIYLGIGGNQVDNLPSGTINDNPYFHYGLRSLLTVNRWYLFTGHVLPASYSAAQLNLSGIYDGTTGQRIASGTDYRWHAGITACSLRTFQFYTQGANRYALFTGPRFDQLDGSEPSIAALLADAVLARANTAFTNAGTAQTTADAANTALTNIARDDILSPSEKPSVVQDYNVIIAEQAGIDAQATATGFTAPCASAKTAYDNAVTALTSYLGGLTGWNTVPGGDVAIVGTTFRSNFAAVYSTKQALLNQIAATAATLASWTGVNSRPDNLAALAGTESVVSTDAAAILGFNPAFSNWAGTYPDGWSSWSGPTPTKEAGIVLGSKNSVRWLTTGVDCGMVRTLTFGAPLPTGTFVTGSFMMYMLANAGGGKPGYLVRLFTNAAQTTYVDTTVPITDNTVGGWQKMPFTAGAAGAAIYSIQIYQMASWAGMPGGNGASGTSMAFGPFTFDVNNPLDNTHIVAASGWLNTNQQWTDVNDASGLRPANNATVGAPSGTYVAGTLAETVVSNVGVALVNASTANTELANPPSLSIAGGDLSSTGNNGTYSYGVRTGAASGGTYPYTYAWVALDGVTDAGVLVNVRCGASTSATSSFSGSATNTYVSATLRCTAVDARGRSASAVVYLTALHGVAG